jgi:hypothetical protein
MRRFEEMALFFFWSGLPDQSSSSPASSSFEIEVSIEGGILIKGSSLRFSRSRRINLRPYYTILAEKVD